MFANNTNLQEYAPEVYQQGVDDWTDELDKAQTDVINMIQFKWFNKFYSRTEFDESKLVDAQWTKTTVYQALYAYILPRLSTFRPEGDPFREQLDFYKDRFQEEWELQFGVGIKYDFEGDGFDIDTDVRQVSQTRLYR
tara:strand:- start:2561 stop:2974 length:414 start_codon:yes stop_codon:yes gene_type:complete